VICSVHRLPQYYYTMKQKECFARVTNFFSLGVVPEAKRKE